MPKLYLVGSGPGDPELITVKALKAIENADAILYDSLANTELLKNAKPDCTKIFSGKRGGEKSVAQEEINQNIIDLAKKVDRIVRLKGGDPMIFGRSFEEITWARDHGIEVEVIPGISSFNAFSSIFQAPITKRKESYGFWIISATTHLRDISDEVAIAAKSSSNIIIFMGLYRLSSIVDELKRHKSLDHPIGVFQGVSTDAQLYTIGTLNNIQKKAEEKGLKSPALVVIGKVLLDIDENNRP